MGEKDFCIGGNMYNFRLKLINQRKASVSVEKKRHYQVCFPNKSTESKLNAKSTAWRYVGFVLFLSLVPSENFPTEQECLLLISYQISDYESEVLKWCFWFF